MGYEQGVCGLVTGCLWRSGVRILGVCEFGLGMGRGQARGTLSDNDARVTVRVAPELLARIDVLARGRDWSRSHWIVRALERVATGEEQSAKALDD
jgi:Ribbon-helix-helix protein, copG family